MLGGAPTSAAVAGPATATALHPAQAVGPDAIAAATASVRALAAFVLVAALGGLLVRRYGPFVDRSIDASMARPLASLAYGVAAHLVIAFAGVYLTTRLTGFFVYGRNVGTVGVLLGVLLVVLAGALGFTVVGSAVVAYGWGPRPWLGLLVGALIAGVAGFLGSVAGGLLWFVVVSMGIGGPARAWLHADADPRG